MAPHFAHTLLGTAKQRDSGAQQAEECRVEEGCFFLEEVWEAGWRGVIKLRPVERIDIWPNKGVPQIKVPDEPY